MNSSASRLTDMNIVYRQTLRVEEYNALREAVGWGALCEEQAARGLAHSAYVIRL